MAQTTLERRYRRLLICYPVSHRAEYGEEMIGVLLDSTPAGQRNPALADALSLFGGGLRVRTRALLANSSDPGWRKALALTTLITPIVLAALAYHQIGWHLAFLPPNFGSLKNAGLMLIPLALGLLRQRRLAAAAAAVSLIWTVSLEAPYHSPFDTLGVPAVSAFVVLMAVQTVAFTLSPGPLIALRLIRPRALALAAPWLLGAAYLARVIPTHYPVPVWAADIGVAAFALACVPALITAGGRRLLMLIVVIPLSAEVVTVLTFANVNFWAFSQTGQLVSLYLPPVVLASMTAWMVGRAQRRSRRMLSLS